MTNTRKIFLIYFLICFSLYIPIESLFLNSEGLSKTEISAIVLSVMIFTGLLEIPTGFLADLISRKLILIFSVMSFILSYSLLIISGSFLGILISYFFEGLGWSFTTGNNESILRGGLDDEQFSVVLSKYYEQGFLALLLSNFIILPLNYFVHNFRLAIAFSLIFRIIALYFAYSIKSKDKGERLDRYGFKILKGAFETIRENKTLFFIEGFSKFTFFIPVVYQLYLLKIGENSTWILVVNLLSFLIMYLSQKLYPTLKHKFSRRRLLFVTGILHSILVVCLLTNKAYLYALFVILVYGLIPIKMQILSEYKHKIATDENRATLISSYSLAVNIVSYVVYFCIGMVLAISYFYTIILWGGLLLLVTLIGQYFLEKKNYES